MYLNNSDEVIEADNGKLILANSGLYCDESGNPTRGCIDDEKQFVYVTKHGKSYHKSPDCRILKNHTWEKVSISEIEDRKPCKFCFK